MNFLELDKGDGGVRALINPDHVTHIMEIIDEKGKVLLQIWLVSGEMIVSEGTYEMTKKGLEQAMRNR